LLRDRAAFIVARFPDPAGPIEVIANGEDQGRETRRRTRRRRDGAHHVELIKDKLILPYLDMDLK
jgi:hypothetical protein